MMKTTKETIISVIFFLCFYPLLTYSQQQFFLTCHSYSTEGSRVVFDCENGSKFSLKFLDSGNIKFWFSSDGDFKRNNASFAVINDAFSDSYTVSVNESPSNFEIFTGELRVRIQKSPLKIQIFDKYQKLLMGDYKEEALISAGSRQTTKKILRDDEQFFGLGEKSGPLNRRGHSYTMWNSDKPCYSDTEDPLYKSIPFFLSSYHYGIFLDNTYKTEFDFGQESDEFFSFSTAGGPFIYYFMYGKNFKEIIKNYVMLTGKPIMPPSWALGWSQSRGMLTNEKLTIEIAEGYRKRGIPCDIIYQDIGWVDGLQNFEWRQDRYENPETMLADLQEEGFKVIVSQDPVISQATQEQWKEANDKGFFVIDDRTGKAYDMPWPWGGNAGVVDFTHPDVADWWGDLQQKPIDAGVKGFWTDMGEPAWSNEESQDRLHMKHYKGMHDEMHNVYGLTWDKVVAEQLEKRNPNQRVFQMTRAAYAGMQRYTFGWSGDSGNGSDVTAGWDNLANQIPVGLSAGMGLIPFWTTDISGYCGDITDYHEFAELYIRWLQFGIFNPLSRAHHEGNNAVEPWLFGAEAEKIAKQSIAFKYEVHPYIYTYARQAYDTGLPIMRAMVLEYQDDKETWDLDGQFMFGDDFLVAPVVKEGAITKSIYLPEGSWTDYHNPLKTYAGNQYITYNAPLDVTPILVKAGAIIPKMPVMPYIGAMSHTPMILEIFPTDVRPSVFEIYEDDGLSNGYKNGEYMTTKIESQRDGHAFNLVINKPDIFSYGGLNTRNYWLEIHLKKKPKSVILNGNKVAKSNGSQLQEEWNTNFDKTGYSYDKESQILFILFPDTQEEQRIKIQD